MEKTGPDRISMEMPLQLRHGVVYQGSHGMAKLQRVAQRISFYLM